MENPFVSIVVPACNEGETIAACLGSLARQNYPKQAYEETPRRPRRRPHPPRFRKSRLKHSAESGTNLPAIAKAIASAGGEKRKNFKELYNFKGRIGCVQLDSSSCPIRPSKKESIKLNAKIIYQKFTENSNSKNEVL